jgi:hypothetical protein
MEISVDDFKPDLHTKTAKRFLYKLYKLEPVKRDARARARLINSASKFQLDMLLKTLHFISNGVIHLRKSQYQRARKAGKFPLLEKTLRTTKDLNVVLRQTKEAKCAFLRQFNIYRQLLYNLFNLP